MKVSGDFRLRTDMYRAKMVCEPCAHGLGFATGTEHDDVSDTAGALLHRERAVPLHRTGVRSAPVCARRATRCRMAADHERSGDLRGVAAAVALVHRAERGRSAPRRRAWR